MFHMHQHLEKVEMKIEISFFFFLIPYVVLKKKINCHMATGLICPLAISSILHYDGYESHPATHTRCRFDKF